MPFLMNPFIAAAAGLVLIDRTLGTNIGNMTSGGGLAALFDGVISQAYAVSAIGPTSTGYGGKTLAAPRVFGQAIAYGSTDQGFVSGSNPSISFEIRGKNGTAPASFADGTLLASLTFTDTTNESAGRILTSTDLVTAWDHLWLTATGSVFIFGATELQLYAWE